MYSIKVLTIGTIELTNLCLRDSISYVINDQTDMISSHIHHESR